MPKVLDSFEFKARGGFGEKVYDWDELLDGQIRQLSKGEDYDCKTLTIQAMARNQAAKRGLGVRVSADNTEGAENVTLQSYEFTKEEKESRKIASANRKAARLAKGDTRTDEEVEAAGEEAVESEQEVQAELEPEPEPVAEKPKPEPKKHNGKKK